VGLLVLIDALAVAAVLALWYFFLSRYNRRKGSRALRWVEKACRGKGHVVETRWRGASRVQAQLGFAAHWFENARVTVRLLPRPMPLQWLLSLWRNERETLTFEADLDYAPGFRLQIFRHRWLTHQPRRLASNGRTWSISQPGPVVLTTRTQLTQELTPVVNALMTTRGHHLIAVHFRPESPHLTATVALDALSDPDGAASFLTVVRDLAAGASTSRQ
jgi:hypothetical protein